MYNQLAVPSRPQLILMLDDDVEFLRRGSNRLGAVGFHNVQTASDPRTAFNGIPACGLHVALIDIHLGGDHDYRGLEFLKHVSAAHPECLPVAVSGDRSHDVFFRAARAGARDFFVKGPYLRLAEEVDRLLHGQRGYAVGSTRRPQVVADLGYLRTFGLTAGEIQMLSEFAVDFPSFKVLADRVDRASVQVRKAFSRIYKKLGLDSESQLVSVLTMCELFAQDS